MSILIKGMEMPENCDVCPLIAEADDYQVCYINEQFIPWEWVDEHSAEQRHPKPSWCPLIELPPHGRLIDERWLKDAMATTLEALIKNPKMDAQEMHIIAAFDTLREMIDDAPTIIEAEESKDG